MGENEIDDNKKSMSNAGEFDCHVDLALQCGAHRPMEHITGFTRSHWMPPSAIGRVLALHRHSGRHG
jgi:hypothetical protein